MRVQLAARAGRPEFFLACSLAQPLSEMQHGAAYINALYFVCVTLVRAPAGHSRERRRAVERCPMMQTTLGYGDIVPLTRAELSFVIVLLCVAVTFVSFITATITSTVVRCAQARSLHEELILQPPRRAARTRRAGPCRPRFVVAGCACWHKRLTERLLSPPRAADKSGRPPAVATKVRACAPPRALCRAAVQGFTPPVAGTSTGAHPSTPCGR